MKYTKNSIVRIIYFVLIFLMYLILLKYYDFSLNTSIYGIFLFMMLFYYLTNVLNFFNYKNTLKDLTYSLLVNFLFFSIFYIFLKDSRIINIFLIYSLFQITIKFLFTLFSQNMENLIIIDSGEYTEKLIKILIKNKNYKYIGYLAAIKRLEDNYLGKIEEIEKVILTKNIDIVLFTNRKQAKIYADLFFSIKMKGTQIVDYISFLEQSEGRIDIEKIDSLWFLMTNGFDVLSSTFNKRLKRMFDIFISFVLLILFLPFIILIYMFIKLDIGLKYIFLNPIKIIKNPAFFKQVRIGRAGDEFEIVKFRSMKIHDPVKYSKYTSENDDRITKIGNFIRKTRLDEIPQLVNILKGEMSFVGPRPEWNELGREYEKKINFYKARYAVQPGLTGWAQVKYSYGENLEDTKQKLEYDLYYIKYQSLLLDILIIIKTIKVVLFGKGR